MKYKREKDKKLMDEEYQEYDDSEIPEYAKPTELGSGEFVPKGKALGIMCQLESTLNREHGWITIMHLDLFCKNREAEIPEYSLETMKDAGHLTEDGALDETVKQVYLAAIKHIEGKPTLKSPFVDPKVRQEDEKNREKIMKLKDEKNKCGSPQR